VTSATRLQRQTVVDSNVDMRVLLLAPTVRDGEITCRLLANAGIICSPVRNLHRLSEELRAGAGAVLLTDEAFTAPGVEEFRAALDSQPPWSEVPVVVMMPGALDSPAAQRMVTSMRNATVLERPALMRSLVSAMQGAIRGRVRQYQIRDQVDAIQQAEYKARELQSQLELALEASELGTFHCEMPQGRIFWNDRCKAHFWLSPDAKDIDFDVFYSLLHPDDRERARLAVEETLSEGKQYDIEYRTVSADGRIRWVRAAGRTFYDMSGNAVRFDGTTRDITQEKLGAEERRMLLESERAARQEAERVSAVKDEFLATLSHELRTPLNAIFGWTQLLMAGKDDPQTLSHALGVIDRNVRLQTQLIEDLLDVSRIISGKIRLDNQKIDVADVIDAAIESVRPSAEAKGIQLETKLAVPADALNGDPGRLQQVIWNLLNNAIKFTDAGGTVHVTAERVNSNVLISVRDTGHGISPEFLPNLFARFSQADSSTQRKYGGLGLGLSIVKSLTEMHGGTVAATSAGEGHGSTFTVKLPLGAPLAIPQDAAPAVSASAKSAAMPRKLRGVKVLVVDDEPDAREMIKRFLDGCEAVPALAASAEQALELMETFRPDVIVSDIGMPKQDGYSFMRTIRNRGVNTPAVALTAFARAEDRVRSIQAGYQTHLPKPFEPGELLALIASLSGRYDVQ
jgi:signal transduction histidine kinase/ActR/RegA family two-component response regulator